MEQENKQKEGKLKLSLSAIILKLNGQIKKQRLLDGIKNTNSANVIYNIYSLSTNTYRNIGISIEIKEKDEKYICCALTKIKPASCNNIKYTNILKNQKESE